MINTAHIAAGAIAENEDGEILMVKEGKEHVKDRWNFPGGSLEPEETIEDCAKREFLEETGYKIKLEEAIGVYFEESVRTGNTVAVFMFEAKLKNKKDKRGEEGEILDEKFFQPEEIKQLNIRKENRLKMLEDFRQGKRFTDSRIVETRD